MFKMFVNFMNAADFLRGMNTNDGDDFYLSGERRIRNAPISVFCDYVPTDYQLSYNPYNILLIMEPNQLFGLHDWAIQNQDKFSCILTWSEKILTVCENSYFFPFGVSWLTSEYVEKMKTAEKKFEVSFLCGAKQRIEGHHLRHRLHARQSEIKIPKKWFYTLPDYTFNDGHHTILNKGQGKNVCWDESMFSICVENSANNGYQTEKIIDAFLSKTIPIYWGCPDIAKFYNPDGIIHCKDEHEIIRRVNALTPDDYVKRKAAIDENYEKAKHYANIYGRFKDKLLEIVEANDITDSEYNSQEMEDRWINENLELPENGVFLDIGACYPRTISNTAFFEIHKKWTGLAIEPDPVYYAALQRERTCILENVAIHPTEKEMWFSPRSNLELNKKDNSIKVDCERLDTLLKKHNIDHIDLISIDVEGFESLVWSSFNWLDYKPKVIITEHTEMGQFNDSFTKELLQNSDYYLAHATPLNFILVRKDVKRKTK